MNRKARQLFNKYHFRITSVDNARRKAEYLFNEGRIGKREIEVLYEGLFLRSHTALEAYLENLFMNIILKKVTFSTNREIGPIFKPRSYIAAIKLSCHRFNWTRNWVKLSSGGMVA